MPQPHLLKTLRALPDRLKRQFPLIADALALADHVDFVDRAAALALFCMFAAVPALFVVLAVIGFLLGRVDEAGQLAGEAHSTVQTDAIARIQTWVHDALPGVTWNPAEFAETLVQHKAAHGVFGTVLAVSLALTVLSRLDHAIRAFFALPERSTFKAAGFLSLFTLVAAFAAMLVTLLGPAFEAVAHIAGKSVTALSLGKLDGIALLVAASQALPVALVFFALVRWSAGKAATQARLVKTSLGFGLCWFLGQRLFSVYVQKVVKMDAVYGALTGIVALMMWLFYANLAFMLAVSLLASAEQRARRVAGNAAGE